MKVPIPALSTITIGKEKLDISKLLSCEYEDIAHASEELPSALAWLCWQKAHAQSRKSITERELERKEAEVFFELKAAGGWEAAGLGGKATDASMRFALRMDDRVEPYFQRLVEHEKWVVILSGLIEALKAKLELVRTTEATRRRLVEPVPTDAEVRAGK